MLLFEWTLLTFIRNGLPGAVVYVHKKLKPGFYNYIKTIDQQNKQACSVCLHEGLPNEGLSVSGSCGWYKTLACMAVDHGYDAMIVSTRKAFARLPTPLPKRSRLGIHPFAHRWMTKKMKSSLAGSSILPVKLVRLQGI